MIPPTAFHNSYARLPEAFFVSVRPTKVAAPRLVALNAPLARELGLDASALATPLGAEIFSGLLIPQGAEPLAMAYAGHQFGQFVPTLGDGRAILLGELRDQNGINRDLQLKGAGLTPFSRRGDGRAALGPVLREYLVSEAMAALGIPTTRALAVVTTGETVWRGKALPGAVLTRVATSHIRIGTFQFFAARGDEANLKCLADYVINRHYPEASAAVCPYLALLEGVIARQASLVAQWLLVGFVHGVMNTDNMSICGETIDYGPCAFMDTYHPATCFSSIDAGGRYAYGRQPDIALWNLCRLAECLLPLLDPDETKALALASAALDGFKPQFEAVYLDGMRRKLGLTTAEHGDDKLVHGLLELMEKAEADFTSSFRRLCEAAQTPQADETLFTGFANWAPYWRARLAQENISPATRRAAMQRVNPAFIPRNSHVEAALALAVEQDDFSGFETLHKILIKPYDDQSDFAAYTLPLPSAGEIYKTFCGT